MHTIVFLAAAITILILAIKSLKNNSYYHEEEEVAKNYINTVINANGLEKACLSVWPYLSIDDEILKFDNSIIETTGKLIAKTFYLELQDRLTELGKDNLADDLATRISFSDNKKQIASTIAGIAFGIILIKNAKSNKKKVSTKTIKKWLTDNNIPNTDYKEFFTDAMERTMNSLTSPSLNHPTVEKNIGTLADILLCIKRNEHDYTDPLFTSTLLETIICVEKQTDSHIIPASISNS